MSLATPTHSHDRPHAHDHGPHAHGLRDHDAHDHGDHDHGAGHRDAIGRGSQVQHGHALAPRRADPGVSLLRMSAAQRFVIVLALVAAIWLGVFWAWA